MTSQLLRPSSKLEWVGLQLNFTGVHLPLESGILWLQFNTEYEYFHMRTSSAVIKLSKYFAN